MMIGDGDIVSAKSTGGVVAGKSREWDEKDDMIYVCLSPSRRIRLCYGIRKQSEKHPGRGFLVSKQSSSSDESFSLGMGGEDKTDTACLTRGRVEEIIAMID